MGIVVCTLRGRGAARKVEGEGEPAELEAKEDGEEEADEMYGEYWRDEDVLRLVRGREGEGLG